MALTIFTKRGIMTRAAVTNVYHKCCRQLTFVCLVK